MLSWVSQAKKEKSEQIHLRFEIKSIWDLRTNPFEIWDQIHLRSNTFEIKSIWDLRSNPFEISDQIHLRFEIKSIWDLRTNPFEIWDSSWLFQVKSSLMSQVQVSLGTAAVGGQMAAMMTEFDGFLCPKISREAQNEAAKFQYFLHWANSLN